MLREGIMLGTSYVVGEPIGRGGNGNVYLGYPDTKYGGPLLAVKVNPPYGQGIKEEITVYDALPHHTHIEQLLTRGWSPEAGHYLGTEFANCGSLGGFLQRGGRLSPQHATKLLVDISDGLGAAQTAGFVHGDVKPDNIFLHFYPFSNDGSPQGRLGDWGSARKIPFKGGFVPTQGFAGTRFYAAPEQLANLLCQKSDTYALGIILFQLMTGKLPFEGNIAEFIDMHGHNVPLPSFAEIRRRPNGSDLENEMEHIARDATHRDIDRRLTVQEFALSGREALTREEARTRRNLTFTLPLPIQAPLRLPPGNLWSPPVAPAAVTYETRTRYPQREINTTNPHKVMELSYSPQQLDPDNLYKTSLLKGSRLHIKLTAYPQSPQIDITREGKSIVLYVLDKQNQRYVLTRGETKIGSSVTKGEKGNIIVVNGKNIDPNHLSVFVDDRYITLKNLVSQKDVSASLLFTH